MMHPKSPRSIPPSILMSIGHTPVPKLFLCFVRRWSTRILSAVSASLALPPEIRLISSFILAAASSCSFADMPLPFSLSMRTAARYSPQRSLK